MEDKEQTTPRNEERKRSKKWLVPLALLLVLLALLGWFLSSQTDDRNTATTAPKTETSRQEQTTATQQESSIKARLENQFDARSRTFLFKADTAALQDEAATTAILGAIAEFYKANEGTKLVVNGSIFDDIKADSTSALAKNRAELIKQRLVARGVPAADVTVSAVDNYEGKDDAARAEYARSVVITAQ